MLLPMWKKYMNETGEKETDEELLKGLISRINIADANEDVSFDVIWKDNHAAGFAFYSVDGGIKGVIPPGYGYIMEFYVEETWRRKGIGTDCVRRICERLKKVGCENIYLTSVPGSEEFWKNCGFTSTDLLDPDNGLHIWIRNI